MKQMKRMTVVLTMQVSREQIVFRVPVQGYELNIGKWQLCVHRQVLVSLPSTMDGVISITVGDKWSATEVNTGLNLLSHFEHTRTAAVSRCKKVLKEQGDLPSTAAGLLKGVAKYSHLPALGVLIKTIGRNLKPVIVPLEQGTRMKVER